MNLNAIRRYWWAGYIVLYAILFYPFQNPNASGSAQIRLLLSFFAVIGGFFLTWTAYPDLRLGNIKNIVPFAKKHPAPFVALLFGFWAVFSSLLSKVPIIGLLGDLNSNVDSAFGTVLLSFIFFLVYFEVIRDQKIKDVLILVIRYLLITFIILAIIEVVLRKSFLIPSALPSDLPVLNFGSNGHLAGFLILLTGGFFSFLTTNFQNTLFLLLLSSFTIGLAFSKAPYASFAATSFFFALNKKIKIAISSAIVITIGALLGFGFIFLVNQAFKRDLVEPVQYQGRVVLYKIALKGILAQPIFGYGGPQFQDAWRKFVTQDELEQFFKTFYLVKYVRTVRDENTGIEMFQVLNDKNKLAFMSVSTWKAHDQFLDIALMWGLVGLVLYLWLISFSFKNLLSFNFFSLSVFAYLIWNLFWYMTIEAEGIFFVILAVSCLQNKSVRNNIVSDA
jgi:O-Antigen ligase